MASFAGGYRAFWAGGPPSSVRREAASFVAEGCACAPGRQRVQRSCHQAWLGSGRCRCSHLRRPRIHFDPFLGAPQSVEFGAPSVRQRTIRATPVLGPRLHHQLADGYMHFDRARGSSGVRGTDHFATCSQSMISSEPAPDLPFGHASESLEPISTTRLMPVLDQRSGHGATFAALDGRRRSGNRRRPHRMTSLRSRSAATGFGASSPRSDRCPDSATMRSGAAPAAFRCMM